MTERPDRDPSRPDREGEPSEVVDAASVDGAPADELDGGDDPVLAAAGARLRAAAPTVSTEAVTAAVLRRRSRRLGAGLVAASVAVVVLATALAVRGRSTGDDEIAAPPGRVRVEDIVGSLDEEPIDPTTVRLAASVSTFADCDALIDDLRRVGAAHVGSRGFGGYDALYGMGYVNLYAAASRDAAADVDAAGTVAAGETIGTNVQVAGVDELDHVKAEGALIYDLDRRGDLRITGADDLAVRSTIDVTPGDPGPGGDRATVGEMLVAEGRVVVFGTEVETSEPVEGDPSATRASTSYLTATFVDATDPTAPEVTDRVRIEGSLVSARLVGGEIRLVTTSHLADLGFVMPTTPASVPIALERNRRTVASSSAADWIPDWRRDGGDPEPLVPCERVYVPDTFAGVAMTSMVTFPLGTGRFEPQATSIVAPGTTLYAGLEKVAISSEVWVDPIDRDRLEFDDWQTAIHEFSFAADAAPGYEGTGVVDGSTVGQFAFGEIGDSLAVVTTEGTPWDQDGEVAVDLTVLTPDGDGSLTAVASVDDLAGGRGAVAAVRFVEGRVLVSTGLFGREVHVIDVTDPAAPRRAGSVTVPGQIGYFHPLPDGRALMVGSRSDTVGTGDDRRSRPWVQVHLLDVSDADAPHVLSTWERPWAADAVGYDHHAFTYWPDRGLAMWGVTDQNWAAGNDRPNHALVLGVGDGAVAEVAVPEASRPNEVAAPCPVVEVTDPEILDVIGRDAVVLRCADADPAEVEWPRYECGSVGRDWIDRYVPEGERDGTWFLCHRASRPTVSRVLVVAGRPMLLTDQTLEALAPDTFASTAIAYHPSPMGWYGY